MAAAGVLLVVLAPPDLSELAEVPELLANGHLGWLGAALLFKVLSYAGYMALFRAVFVAGETRIGWRESYAITMAGVAATRLFASAGAGGVALTAWALHRLGVPSRRIAERMVTFLVLLYGVYLACLVVFGLGLWAGVLPGSAPWALTLVPALIGALGIAAGLALGRIPADLDRVGGQGAGAGKLRRTLTRIRDFFAGAGRGVRVAVAMLRRGEPGLLGAPAWWGFDIAVLWASFLAFGEPPPVAVLVVAYFVGMLGNLLPLPGGAGGVEGGMIGALVAFGVSGGLAVVAVLVYRLFAFWLPTLPGALAYLQLRRDFAGRPSRARPRRTATALLAVRGRLTYGRLAWLVAAVVIGGAYLAGVFPALPGAQEAVQALGDELGAWSYAVVGGLALLETAALIGLLAPGEWSAIIGGAVAAEGAVGVALLTVTVWVCAATGHSLSFVAGRRFGRAFLVRHGPRLRVGPERLDRVDRFFARHGAKAVVGGQFIGLARAVMPFLAGASGMTYRRFVLPSVVGTGAWAAAFTLLGYFAYRSLAEVEHAVSVAAGAALALAAVVAGAAWLRHRRRSHGYAQERAAVGRLTLKDGSILDVRPIELCDRPELAAFLTGVDDQRHEALVALEPITARGIAVARYVAVAHDPAVADVAVTVDDRWQGRGLGTSLAGLLIERAAAEGLDRLRATVGGDNARALGLARRIGYEVSCVGSDSVELERSLSSNAIGPGAAPVPA